MQIIARCPECCKTWLLDGSLSDRRIKCRDCGRVFRVPKAEQVPKATEVIERAKGTVYVDESGRTYG